MTNENPGASVTNRKWEEWIWGGNEQPLLPFAPLATKVPMCTLLPMRGGRFSYPRRDTGVLGDARQSFSSMSTSSALSKTCERRDKFVRPHLPNVQGS